MPIVQRQGIDRLCEMQGARLFHLWAVRKDQMPQLQRQRVNLAALPTGSLVSKF